jgi:hypothetical protein
MQHIDNDFSHKITVFSLCLAVSIVCYHLNPTFDFQKITNDGGFVDSVSNYLNELLTSFGGLALSYFFLNSAFLTYRNFSLGQFPEKLKRRIRSLFVPLLLWNILCLVYKMRFDDGFMETVKNILLSNYCGPLWFVVQLLVMFLLSPVFHWILKHKTVGLCMVALAFFLPPFFDLHVVGLISINVGSQLVLSRTVHYLPLFLMGIFLALHFDAFVQQERYRTKFLLIFSALVLVASLLPFEHVVLDFLRQFQILALWVLVPKKWFQKKLPWTFGISFFIYASHAIVIGVIMRLLHHFVLDETMAVSIGTAMVARLFFTLISVTSIYLASWILIRWFPKIYAILTGGRTPF